MGLKQSIVIKNQFTIRDHTGEGSRGSTPGEYVERYMGRGDAIEPCLPVMHTSPAAYIERYMARRDATLAAPDLVSARVSAERMGEKDGVGFSRESVSLSERELKDVSARIQSIYDAGQPVLKCVLSFDTEYLREERLIPVNTHVSKRGDLRGQVDQLRLRSAIIEGLDGLAHHFDDLVCVGVLQFDTEHVHAHLALAEGNLEGTKRMRHDGQHRGKLNEEEMRLLRNGIDRSLDMTKRLPYLSADISSQRRNVRSFVRRYAADVLSKSGDMQLIIASLPRDERTWRAHTHRRDMQRANQLTRDFVRRTLALPESGYAQVEAQIKTYAKERAAREGKGAHRERELYTHGIERIEDECVNGVYAELSAWQHRPVHTRPIDVMASDIAEAAQLSTESEADAFMFRLRTYGGRMLSARDKRQEMRDSAREWERQTDLGLTASESIAAYNYYQAEMMYQTQVMCKYQGLFPLGLLEDTDDELLRRLRRTRQVVRGMERILTDDRFIGMTQQEAESFGFTEYGIRGAGDLVASPRVFAAHLEAERAQMQQDFEDAAFAFANAGRVLTMDDYGVHIRLGSIMRFEDVRGVDLHHLGYDFDGNQQVGDEALAQFRDAYHQRSSTMRAAADYFLRSGNDFAISQLPIDDVTAMGACLSEIEAHHVLPTARRVFVSRVPINTVTAEPEVAARATEAVFDQLERSAQAFNADVRDGIV